MDWKKMQLKRHALTGISYMIPVVVAGGTIYAFALFGVFLFAVITGWGRTMETESGGKK